MMRMKTRSMDYCGLTSSALAYTLEIFVMEKKKKNTWDSIVILKIENCSIAYCLCSVLYHQINIENLGELI